MVTIRIKIYHRLSGHQLSYHQTFDGGEYKIRYTEYMKIMVDNVHAIDYNTLSIISEYERQHNGEWTDEDVSWFEVCNNNDDYDRYDNEEQSKYLLNHIDLNKYQLIFLTDDSMNSITDEDSSFYSPSLYYDQIFYADVRNCDEKISNQISSLFQHIEILNKRFEAFKLSIEDRKQKAQSEIESLQQIKQRKIYEFFRTAIIEGNISYNMIIPEYGKTPLELAIQNDDFDLLTLLCENIGETFCLSEKYIKRSQTVFGAEEDNRAFKSLYNRKKTIIQDCVYLLICHNNDAKLYQFLRDLLNYQDQIYSVSESTYTDIHVAYFIMLIVKCNLDECFKYLYKILSEKESIRQRFCMEVEFILASKNGKDNLRKDKKYSDMLSFLSLYDNCNLLSSVCNSIKKILLCAIQVAENDNEDNYVDLGLPSGTKWRSHSVGYLMPHYSMDIPCVSYDNITDLSECTKKNTIEVLFNGKYDFPEVEDFQELLKYCDWHWQKEMFLDNGNYRLGGYEVVGKNGNRLFLRAAGYKDENDIIQECKNGFYWTNTKDELHSNNPISFAFDGLGKFTNFITGSIKDNVMILPIMRSSSSLTYKDMLEQGKEEDLNPYITEYESLHSVIDEHGFCYTADEKKLIKCPKNINIEKYSVKGGVKVLGLHAFGHCKSLKEIDLPNSLIIIGNGAFTLCSNLYKIQLPNSVKKIEKYAFMGCKALESIIIPENVTSIGNAAFWNCVSLQTVTLNCRLTYIGEGVFRDCVSLKEIRVPKELLFNYRQLLPNFSDILVGK